MWPVAGAPSSARRSDTPLRARATSCLSVICCGTLGHLCLALVTSAAVHVGRRDAACVRFSFSRAHSPEWGCWALRGLRALVFQERPLSFL